MPRKRSQKSKLQDQADALWAEIIRCIWPRCAVCNEAPPVVRNIQAHHLIGRARRATRYKIENGIGLCPSHHVFSSTLSAHGAPLAFSDWLRATHPGIDQWVREHHRDIVTPITEGWYREQIERLEQFKEGL